MSEGMKMITVESVKNVLYLLTFLGTLTGVYISLSERVLASEQKIAYIESSLKGMPETVAKIDTQIGFIREDIARMKQPQGK